MSNCAICGRDRIIVDHHREALRRTLGEKDPAELAIGQIHAALALADALKASGNGSGAGHQPVMPGPTERAH
jgi:hypothetical protein